MKTCLTMIFHLKYYLKKKNKKIKTQTNGKQIQNL